MSCLNWLPSDAGVAYFAEGATNAQGGHTRYGDGAPVKFWWFDARDLSTTSTYPEADYAKIASAEVTLVLTASTNAKSLIMSGLASIALASATLLF